MLFDLVDIVGATKKAAFGRPFCCNKLIAIAKAEEDGRAGKIK